MSSKTIGLVAMLGLVASGANAATLRSADVVSAPRSTASEVAPAKAKLAASTARTDVGCFVPLKNGRMPKLAEIRKAKASSACGSNKLADASGGGVFSGIGAGIGGVLPTVLIGAAVGAGVGYGVSEANKQDYSPGGAR